jgi:hypothetical protein
VKSPGENQGSTFVVALPISYLQEETQRVSQPTIATQALDTIELPRLDNVSVLIVDDEPDGRTLIGRILEGRGALPTCASSAEEALAHLRRERYDILLSDIGMPDVDGYELIRQVRALESDRRAPIPAIAITAYARSEDRQRSLLAGYQMHMAKPIEARELVAAIASLLSVSQ